MQIIYVDKCNILTGTRLCVWACEGGAACVRLGVAPHCPCWWETSQISPVIWCSFNLIWRKQMFMSSKQSSLTISPRSLSSIPSFDIVFHPLVDMLSEYAPPWSLKDEGKMWVWLLLLKTSEEQTERELLKVFMTLLIFGVFFVEQIQLSNQSSLAFYSQLTTHPPTPTHTHTQGSIHKCLALAVIFIKTFHWKHLSPNPEQLFVEVRTRTMSSPWGVVIIPATLETMHCVVYIKELKKILSTRRPHRWSSSHLVTSVCKGAGYIQ